MMQKGQGKVNLVRHVSISFKDLIQHPKTTSNTFESYENTPEKVNFPSNRQSKTKILHISLSSLLKENQGLQKETHFSEIRRQRLKQLSSGYKLRKDSLSLTKLTN